MLSGLLSFNGGCFVDFWCLFAIVCLFGMCEFGLCLLDCVLGFRYDCLLC